MTQSVNYKGNRRINFRVGGRIWTKQSPSLAFSHERNAECVGLGSEVQLI
jgi:hypothetical protein